MRMGTSTSWNGLTLPFFDSQGAWLFVSMLLLGSNTQAHYGRLNKNNPGLCYLTVRKLPSIPWGISRALTFSHFFISWKLKSIFKKLTGFKWALSEARSCHDSNTTNFLVKRRKSIHMCIRIAWEISVPASFSTFCFYNIQSCFLAPKSTLKGKAATCTQTDPKDKILEGANR